MSKLNELLADHGKFEKSLNKLKDDGVLENLYKLDFQDVELFLELDAIGGDKKLMELFNSYNESYIRLHNKAERMRNIMPLSQLVVALELGIIGVLGIRLEVGMFVKIGLIVMVFIAYNAYANWVDRRLKKLNEYIGELDYDQDTQTDLIISADKYLEIKDRIYKR